MHATGGRTAHPKQVHSFWATLAIEITGFVLVLFTLREVFRDIFHPTRSGTLSDWIGSVSSTVFRHTRLRPAAGPLALVAVLLAWMLSLALGFGLIYFGHYPGDFASTQGGVGLSLMSRTVHCLYLSLGALCTFQTFDLSPTTNWLRVVIGLEGLIGISMITASVSWLVLLYPALERQRRGARHLSLLATAEERSGVSAVDAAGAVVLHDLAQDMLQMRLDMVLFPLLLHFYATREEFTLYYVLPTALRLARQGAEPHRPPDVRLAAAELQISLAGLADTIASRVLGQGDGAGEASDPDAVFRAFADRQR